MILESGSKVLVSHRRLFEGDHPRYFVGLVEGYEAGMARVCGYTWLKDSRTGAFRRKDDVRTKIISVASDGVIVYQLPSSTDVERARFEAQGVRVVLSDGGELQMDLTEGQLVDAPYLGQVARPA